jgi:lipooligosaccharide transport system permease protein
LVIPLTGLLFAAIGLVFSLRIPNIDLFSFYFTLFLTPMFLFSDVFFPLEERLTQPWLWVAEALPLLHPVRLARASFSGEFSPVVLWDLFYTGRICFAAVHGASERAPATDQLIVVPGHEAGKIYLGQ